MERRTFIKSVAAAGFLGPGAAQAATEVNAAMPTTAAPMGAADAAAALPRVTDAGELSGDMLYRTLGATGVRVSAIGMGGAHIGKASLEEAESIRLMHAAIDRGITFMDNCWDYNEGRSELRMGKALAQNGYRSKVVLMTKIDGRTKEEANRQLDTSLERLQTDRIDVVQHHEILRFDDPDRVFAEGGSMEALVAARQAGKIRFIGFTGHKDPRIHLYMLDVAAKHGFHFDTVQMPNNVMDAHFRSFGQLVIPRAVREKIAVLGMKAFGDGVILKSKTVAPIECLHYALNLPVSVQITGIDDQRSLDQAFEAAKTFRPMTQQQVAELLGKTEQAASKGEYELFKTTAHFDSTAKHPDWLGGETPNVQKLAPNTSG